MPRHYIIFWLTNNAYSLCSLLQIQIVSAHGIHLMDIPGTCVNHVLCGNHHRLLRSGENAAEHPDRAWDGCEAKVKFPIKTWMRHRPRADLWNFPFYEVIRSREMLLWKRKKAPFQGMFDREKQPALLCSQVSHSTGQCGYDFPSPQEVLQETLDSGSVRKALGGITTPHDRWGCGDHM